MCVCWVGGGGGAGGLGNLHSLLLAMDKQQCVCVGWVGGGVTYTACC